MKELTGVILIWDEASGQGQIQGDDGKTYCFTKKEWVDKHAPQTNGQVRVICQDGRNASQIEYLPIEGLPWMTVKISSPDGRWSTTERRRFIGGPWRLRSDALAWMKTARVLHSQFAQHQIKDLSNLLLGVDLPIGIRCSVIKYSFGFSIELYLKWILKEAKQKFRKEHHLRPLVNKLPPHVLNVLRERYLKFQETKKPTFRMLVADVNSVSELELDWSTFDNFISNLDNQKFIIGRYATPESYSIFSSNISEELSKEMNSYIDSVGFFDIGDDILSYEPNPNDYV